MFPASMFELQLTSGIAPSLVVSMGHHRVKTSRMIPISKSFHFIEFKNFSKPMRYRQERAGELNQGDFLKDKSGAETRLE